MKKICCLLFIVWGLVACGGGAGDSGSSSGNDAMRTLQQDESVSGTIAEVGEVDWFDFNAVEANRTLTVSCTDTYGDGTPLPLDFMLTIYEKDADGNLIPIFGQSAPDNTGGDIHINVGIHRPRHLYFAVRDFMDDESSDQVQYRIRVSYSDETTNNETFADAIDIAVGAAQVCYSEEAINVVGDVDCYRFSVAAAGVYKISAQFAVSNIDVLPANLNLGLELYDAAGQLVYQFKGQRPGDGIYAVPAYFAAGDYYMVVDDQGRDGMSEYTYNLCVEPMAVAELMQDDTSANAQNATDALIEASLEYFQDEDWYAVDVPAGSGTTSSNIRINLHNNFDAMTPALESQIAGYSYRIEIRDAADTVLHAYDHPAAATEAYTVEFASGQAGLHRIMVKPIFNPQMAMALPYQLRIELEDVDDPGEAQDPRTLNPAGETVTGGKISKLGDVDEYRITVNTTTAPKVLEVIFQTSEPSEVAYNLHVMWDDNHHILKDINGTQSGTSFKSSYYLPVPDTVEKNTTVTMQVSDDQNNDGADVEYTLTVGVLEIPGSITPNAAETAIEAGAGGAVYFDEPGERTAGSGATEVTVIEYDYHYQPRFSANNSLLRVDSLVANQWTSPWITGFVDYDSDRDVFKLNFDDVTPTDGSSWYFDIEVRMFALGSDVEYSWALFRDRPAGDNAPPNDVLLERPFWEDPDGTILQYDDDAEGVVAFWGDDSLAGQNYSETIPTGEQQLWVGHRWGDSNFYLSIQDFNIALLEKVWNNTIERWDPVPNQTPDNDWGNTNSNPVVRPYYFQVTVTYHPGCSSPDECN